MAQQPPNGTPSPAERDRRAAESPPGSSERVGSDVTGWSIERDEAPEARQGRFHRAAQLRMATPRTEATGPGGPYGRDDRSLDEATGRGTGPLMGEQDWEAPRETQRPTREYRPWNRQGSGAEGESARTTPRPPMPPPAPSRRWPREPLTAREVMTRQVRPVRPDTGLHEVARVMKDEDCGVVPVVDERGRLRGVVTDRDLVVRVLAEGRALEGLQVQDVMTEEVEAVQPHETLTTVIALMGQHQVRRVPVVERDDRLVGLISMADIATRAEHDEELQEALHRISARRSFWSRLY
ncbi:CBS domain-containing protein [Archangium primigenium]|uniref:CBS domain-containing protein n=1 Tax=[Archangium] primigenium TaxID=2792470 RepID=UPI00195A8165|nr:CBS domain-containing protein [Archangium primigenium]MBM7112682.1 CBS domain-containing protein [Archangium primigenium]